MTGQMCWLGDRASSAPKILHLRRQPHHPWQPYTAFPRLAAPDHNVPGGSKGWATYQKLFKAGWTLISTAEAQSVPPLAAALTQR